MIITAVQVSNGTEHKACVIDWMPPLATGRPWNTFSHELNDRTLQPGSELVLLELTEYDGEQNYAICREAVRAALAPLTISVSYTDIYNKALPVKIKPLSWFGRHK